MPPAATGRSRRTGAPWGVAASAGPAAWPEIVAPTRILVVSGFYRFVRNPMYVAVMALIVGQAILFASWGVALYGAIVAAAFDTFVRLYEEPTLRQAYGEQYAAYCAATPRWIPRFRV